MDDFEPDYHSYYYGHEDTAGSSEVVLAERRANFILFAAIIWGLIIIGCWILKIGAIPILPTELTHSVGMSSMKDSDRMVILKHFYATSCYRFADPEVEGHPRTNNSSSESIVQEDGDGKSIKGQEHEQHQNSASCGLACSSTAQQHDDVDIETGPRIQQSRVDETPTLSTRDENVAQIMATRQSSSSRHHAEESTCACCKKEFVKDDFVTKGSTCPHQFHFSCLMEWLIRHEHCPLCQTFMVTPNEFFEAAKQRMGKEWIKEERQLTQKHEEVASLFGGALFPAYAEPSSSGGDIGIELDDAQTCDETMMSSIAFEEVESDHKAGQNEED